MAKKSRRQRQLDKEIEQYEEISLNNPEQTEEPPEVEQPKTYEINDSPTHPSPNIDIEQTYNSGPTRFFGAIAIIAGILVVAAGYVTYNYFTQASQNKIPLAQVEVEQQGQSTDAEGFRINDSREETVNEGFSGLIGEGTSTTRDSEGISEAKETAIADFTGFGETEQAQVQEEAHVAGTSTWLANDYK